MGDASTTPSTTARVFSGELFAAVYKDHTALNKLITSRLPLCLPPHTDQPLLYLQGLQVFGHVFQVFEKQRAQELQEDALQDRIAGALSLLDIPGLQRTNRLERDFKELKLRLRERKLKPNDSRKGQAIDVLDHSWDRFLDRPHLILAHAWAMYLALFNGGRWIRKQLRDAGDDFWMGSPPVSFWEFGGDQDGDDVHAQFKENFELAAQRLTSEEWEETVQEAKEVFALCSRLVAVLDEVSAEDQRRKDAQIIEQRTGLMMGSWYSLGCVGVLCLLIVVWSFLLQTNAT